MHERAQLQREPQGEGAPVGIHRREHGLDLGSLSGRNAARHGHTRWHHPILAGPDREFQGYDGPTSVTVVLTVLPPFTVTVSVALMVWSFAPAKRARAGSKRPTRTWPVWPAARL